MAQWVSGQSGNPTGGKSVKPFIDQIYKLCAQEEWKRLRAAGQKLLDAAENGEPWAIQMLADRMDGRPAQQVQVSGDPENPLQVQHTVDLGEAIVKLLDRIRGENT